MTKEIIKTNQDPQLISPELSETSATIFKEAIANIPQPEVSKYIGLDCRQTTYATTAVARYLAESDPESGQKLIINLQKQVDKMDPERSKARCLLNILETELALGWASKDKTAKKLFDSINEGVPEDHWEEWIVKTIETIAEHSPKFALQFVEENIPQLLNSDIKLRIANEQSNYDLEGAGKAMSEYLLHCYYLEPEVYWGKNFPTTEYSERPGPSRIEVANRYAWLVARFGNMDLAEKMALDLSMWEEDNYENERMAVLAEIGAREPGSNRGREYTLLATELLEKKDVWPVHFKRLAKAYEKTNPVLASQFQQRYEEPDAHFIQPFLSEHQTKSFDLDVLLENVFAHDRAVSAYKHLLSTPKVLKILAEGNFAEACRIIKVGFKIDSEKMIFDMDGSDTCRGRLERVLVDISKTHDARVFKLVNENFEDDAELKIEILITASRKIALEGEEVGRAKRTLLFALEFARALKTTTLFVPNNESWDNEILDKSNEKGKELSEAQEERIDPSLMKIKAWKLAKIGAAMAFVEKQSQAFANSL